MFTGFNDFNLESITDYLTQAFTQWVQNLQWKAKDYEDAAHKGKILKIKASWSPLNVLGPEEVSLVSTQPSPSSRWAWPLQV